VPLGKNEFLLFDDKDSFNVRISTAEIAVASSNLENVLNSYVFARPHSPLNRAIHQGREGAPESERKAPRQGGHPVRDIPQKRLPATIRRSEVEVGSFLDSRRREGGPSGQGRHLPVSWTSNQFPPAEPSCKLNESQSKVRLWANSPLGCRAIGTR
jgi:hypothetical protein